MVSVALTLNQSASANSLGLHPGCQANQTPLSATLRRGSTPQQTTVAFIEALDHLSTKLKIPMSAVEPTNALQDDGLVPGICRLYLEGRCRQGSRCFQVHARRDVLDSLRKEALETPSCCYLHGAPCNYEGLPFNLTVNIGSKAVGLHSLNPTNCLWSIYSEHGETLLTVSKGRVCREHRRGLCRFGEECGFLHICREIPLDGDEYISATPVPIPRVQGRGTRAGEASASAVNCLNNASRDVTGDIHHQSLCGSQMEETNITTRTPNASSFNNASFNGGYFSGGLNGQHGSCNNQSNSLQGIESGYGTPCSTSRSRMSYGYRAKYISHADGEERAIKGPLLRPLGGGAVLPRGPMGQRHNPYGDASSFQ
ncbi:hypothetical protein TcBrA4_0092380 [Trypanosoma cruzi]|nr:hypothetical protein TcBrA4_0092380 [Trypanosoma cruzi]